MDVLWQEDKAEGKEQDESKGVEMAGDFDGSLHDMQADPEADDQEQEEEGQEGMDQVPSLPSACSDNGYCLVMGRQACPFCMILPDINCYCLLGMGKLTGWQGSPDTTPHHPLPRSPTKPPDPP